MARLVRFRILDDIAIITLDQPPANALSAQLRAGLWEVIGRVDENPDIKAAVLIAAGPMFSAGGDIRGMDEVESQPSLRQICDRIETCSKPFVVGVHGRTLGGGCELMLAGHYRLAAGDVRIGLPEVALGLVPVAGGTQRLPRLIGAERALQMMISTQSVDAQTARNAGLIDGIVDGDLGAGAVAFAQKLVAQGKGPNPTRALRTFFQDARAYQASISKARAALKDNPLHAPKRVVDCVEVAPLLPFDAALNFEADAFARCMNHPQATALRHVFLAERKIDEALIKQDAGSFNPVEPMGKSVVHRLRLAMRAAADHMAANGLSEAEIDGALIAFGFRKGPFGTKISGDKNDEVVRRVIAALITEGAACVQQEAVERPSDIDALAVHGLGFPRREGGPLRAGQTLGLLGLRKSMTAWAEENAIWTVPPLMNEAIKDSRGFDALA